MLELGCENATVGKNGLSLLLSHLVSTGVTADCPADVATDESDRPRSWSRLVACSMLKKMPILKCCQKHITIPYLFHLIQKNIHSFKKPSAGKKLTPNGKKSSVIKFAINVAKLYWGTQFPFLEIVVDQYSISQFSLSKGGEP